MGKAVTALIAIKGKSSQLFYSIDDYSIYVNIYIKRKLLKAGRKRARVWSFIPSRQLIRIEYNLVVEKGFYGISMSLAVKDQFLDGVLCHWSKVVYRLPSACHLLIGRDRAGNYLIGPKWRQLTSPLSVCLWLDDPGVNDTVLPKDRRILDLLDCDWI